MKKITFAWLALLFVSASNAQIKLGVNAGATYSGFRGMNVATVDYQPGFGFMAGLSAEYSFSEKLALKTNLSYDRKSNRGKSAYELRMNFDDPPLQVDQTVINDYDYLSLPILVKYSFGKDNGFFVNGGPFVAYLLHSETRSKSDPDADIDFTDPRPFDTTSYNKRLDYGLSFGIGKSFRLSDKNHLVVEIRDNLGLSNTNKFSGGSNIKTNSVNLILGWQFNL